MQPERFINMKIDFNKENNTRNSPKNQALTTFTPLHPDFLSNPERAFQEHFTPNKRKGIDRMFEHIQKNGVQHKPQKYWAKIFGVCHITANAWIKQFESLGLINRIKGKKVVRYVMEPDAYQISPYFSYPDVKSRFSKYIPSLKYFSLALLVVTSLFSSGGVLANGNYTKTSYKEKVIRNLRLNNRASRKVIGVLEHSNWNGAMDFETVIPDYIQRLSCLEFTRAGMVRLLPYPSDALAYAQRCLINTKKFVKNPFAYFISLCDQYCKDYEIKPNWQVMELAQKAFHFKNSDDMVTTNVVNKKKVPQARAIKSTSLSVKSSAISSPSPQNHKRDMTISNELTIAEQVSAIRKKHDKLEEIERRRNAEMQYAKPQAGKKTSGSVKRPIPPDVLESYSRTKQIQAAQKEQPKKAVMQDENTLKRFASWGLDPVTFKKVNQETE